MAGYSAVPLLQKLGVPSSGKLLIMHAPDYYHKLVPEAAADTLIGQSVNYDWIHAFFMSSSDLSHEIMALKTALATSGQLWISWPKKASGKVTDLNDNVVRELGLATGLVDVKVAAIDETWSAMKFVYRLRDR